MSLKVNILANYASQIYLTLIGISLIPLYINYLGVEAYGLIGFFAMLQVWFSMLDLGLSPTISRESARYHGGATSALEYRRIFRALSLIFITISITGGGVIFIYSNEISTRWLKVESLAHTDVIYSIQIMAISVALRWMCGLFRGVISGAEQILWLSGFTSLIATLRFIGVLGSMWLWGYNIPTFFTHQLIVAAFEAGGLLLMSRNLLPKIKNNNAKIGWSLYSMRPLLGFGLTIALSSSIWVAVTQTDKLILSGILSLTEYGYFTLAVLVSSVITTISGPISSAIMPRMARLHAEKNNHELIRIYREATQWISILAGSVTITMVLCAEPLLFAWSNNAELAKNSAPILKLYAIGNGFLAISAFPYYLQYAKGNVRLHLIGNLGLAALFLPCIFFSASQFGAKGAGVAWACTNILYLLTWLAYTHHKLEPGLHWDWIKNDVLKIILPAISLASTIELLPWNNNTLLEMITHISLTGTASLSAGILANSSLRSKILKKFGTIF